MNYSKKAYVTVTDLIIPILIVIKIDEVNCTLPHTVPLEGIILICKALGPRIITNDGTILRIFESHWKL